MGMYTECALAIEFCKDTPEEIIDAIHLIIDGRGSTKELAPALREESLFLCERWRGMLCGSSYYFAHLPNVLFKRDDITDMWQLTFWSNIKNYDNEWSKFLTFIAPFVDRNGHAGHLRYEEDAMPTLIVFDEGKLQLVAPPIDLHLADNDDDDEIPVW